MSCGLSIDVQVKIMAATIDSIFEGNPRVKLLYDRLDSNQPQSVYCLIS